MNLDTSTEFGQRVARRLDEEQIIWLTTTAPDGRPQPSPVWFLWDGESVLIYSRDDTPKLRNIRANGQVALNFNCTAEGGDVIAFAASAVIDADAPRADAIPAYLHKYRQGIGRIGMDPASFSEAYGVAIRVRPDRVRGH